MQTTGDLGPTRLTEIHSLRYPHNKLAGPELFRHRCINRRPACAQTCYLQDLWSPSNQQAVKVAPTFTKREGRYAPERR